MFSIYCPRHKSEVLLSHRQILGIDGSGSELTVHWRCWCGHRGSHHPQQRATASFPISA